MLRVDSGLVRGRDPCSLEVWRPAEREREREKWRDTKQLGRLDRLIIPLRRKGGGEGRELRWRLVLRRWGTTEWVMFVSLECVPGAA